MGVRKIKKAFFVSICLALIVLVGERPIFADEKAPRQQVSPSVKHKTTIIILASSRERPTMQKLGEALEAYLHDYGVVVRLHAVSESRSSFDLQSKAARRGLEATSALSAIWFDWDHEMVYVLVRNQSIDDPKSIMEQILDRPLPRSRGDGEVSIDAVASLVRSVLTEWLEQSENLELMPIENEKEVPEEEHGGDVADEKLTTNDSETRRLIPLSFYVAGGYTPLFASFADTVQHGGTLRGGVLVTRYVECGLGLDLLGFVRVESSTDSIAISRWPLRFRTVGILPLGRLELGLEASFVLNITRVLGLENENVGGAIQRVDPAFATSVTMRHQLFDRLAVWAEVGADFYGIALKYEMNDETLIRFSPVQLRGAVGLAVIFPVR